MGWISVLIRPVAFRGWELYILLGTNLDLAHFESRLGWVKGLGFN
jgi:hypothetical protein